MTVMWLIILRVRANPPPLYVHMYTGTMFSIFTWFKFTRPFLEVVINVRYAQPQIGQPTRA